MWVGTDKQRGPGRRNSVYRAPSCWREARGSPALSGMETQGEDLKQARDSQTCPSEAILLGPRLTWHLGLQPPHPVSPGPVSRQTPGAVLWLSLYLRRHLGG